MRDQRRFTPCDREPSQRELEILDRLASRLPESHRSTVEAQIPHLRVSGEHRNGHLAVMFDVQALDDVPRLSGDGKLPVDGFVRAADGVTTLVEILIFSYNGLVCELEVYRPDGGELVEFPDPALIETWSADDESV